MPRIKMLVLADGQNIWYPNQGDLNYHKNKIIEVWIEERLTLDEFKEISKKRVFLKNKS